MKFIHTADIHWGMVPDSDRPWGKKREQAIRLTFQAIIEDARDSRADLLLISGDLFHRQPLARDLKEVNYLFSTIPGTRVVIIAGNHDRIRKSSALLSFSWHLRSPAFLSSPSPSRENKGLRTISPFSIPTTSSIAVTFRLLFLILATWTITSRADAIWLLMAGRGSSIPIRTIVSSLASISRQLLAWPVQKLPSWPVFMAWSRSTASWPRTSPITIRSPRGIKKGNLLPGD